MSGLSHFARKAGDCGMQLLQDAVQRLNIDDSGSQGLVYIYSPDGTECYEVPPCTHGTDH